MIRIPDSLRQCLPGSIPLMLFLLALMLRLAGLNHDIEAGKVYHPDTPKQIEAIQLYMDGIYAFETGHPDYDGYAYGSSLIVAKIASCSRFVSQTLVHWMGFTGSGGEWTTHSLFILFRVYNALLSAAAVWVLWLLVRAVSRSIPAASLAATLLAVSPVDISACHYAAGDSASAFFGLMGCWFALKILQHGRTRHYLFCALFVVLSLSTKYHGVFSGCCLIMAHGSRLGWGRRLFCNCELKRTALTAAVAALTFLVMNPAFLIRPEAQLENVRIYFEKVSSFGTPEAVLEAGFASRFSYGMRHNIPVLFNLLKPVPFIAGALGGLLAFLPRIPASYRVIAILPLSYLLLGISTKPGCQAVYHTMITPQVFALTALLAFELIRNSRRIRVPALLLTGLLSGITVYQMSLDDRRELFMFRHADTRALAEDWILENLPNDFVASISNYAQMKQVLATRSGDVGGRFGVIADRKDSVSPTYKPIARFDIETFPLPVFRNFHCSILLPETQPGLNADFQHPFPAPIASESQRGLLFPENQFFYRDPCQFRIGHEQTLRKHLVLTNTLDHIQVLISAEFSPARIRISNGSNHQDVDAQPGLSQLIELPVSFFQTFQEDGPRFYPLTIESTFGNAFIALCVTPDQRAVARLRSGDLSRPAEEGGSANPSLNACMQLAAGGKVPPLPTGELQTHYGVSDSFLQRLPYLQWNAEDLHEHRGYAQRTPDRRTQLIPVHTTAAFRTVTTPAASLAAGTYRIWLRFSDTVETDPRGIVAGAVLRGGLRLQEAGGLRVIDDRVEATVSVSGTGCPQFQWSIQSDKTLNILSAGVQPLARESLERLQAAIDSFQSGKLNPNAICGQNVSLFLQRGIQCADDENPGEALKWLNAAKRCAPVRKEAADQIAKLQQQPANQRYALDQGIRFRNGALLNGGVFPRTPVKPGSGFRFILDWSQWRNIPHMGALSVWIHIQDESGKTVAQGDYPLYAALNQASLHHYRIEPRKIALPADLPPGTYNVLTGIWRPDLNTKIKLTERSANGSDEKAIVHQFEVSSAGF